MRTFQQFKKCLFITTFSVIFICSGHAQEISAYLQDTTKEKVIVIKNDGSAFVGTIITRDERELLMETESIGRIYIPLHEIRQIKPYDKHGKGSSLFATRYFLTTNGLSMNQGDRYVILNWYGPEAHFAVGNSFSVGIMTSWIAMPIIGSAKYSVQIDEKVHLGLGLLAGSLSWAKLSSAGALVYGTITYGDFISNLSFSAGYAGVRDKNGSGSAPLLSPACLLKIGKNIHFVMDSFIYLGEDDNFAILVPGLRFTRPLRRSSIQFGFAGTISEGELMPAPFPIVAWFYEL